MKYVYLFVLGIALSGTAYAELGKPGFSGEVGLFAVSISEKSNMNTENEATIESRNSEGESDIYAKVGPQGYLRYTFGEQNNHQLSFGIPRRTIVEAVNGLEFGYAIEFDDASVLSLDYVFLAGNDVAWKDPYLTGIGREETDISGDIYQIKYDKILGTRLAGDFAIYNQDIDKEESGTQQGGLSLNQQKLLQRDADGYRAGISMKVPFSRTSFITPSLFYQNHSADGEAMSFKKYGIELTYVHIVGRHIFLLNGDYATAGYGEENPLFGRTREDDTYGINFIYKYNNFMGWEDVGFNVLLGSSHTASNIAFYETTRYFSGLGLTYQF